MKKLLIFSFVILFCSCQKETPPIENSNDELKTIQVETLKKLLPLTTSNSKTKAVFYNAEGNEIIFDFILEEEIKEKIAESKTYLAEEISGSYINESINDYSLYFQASGNYFNMDEFNLFVNAGINQFVEPTVSILSFNDAGTPIFGTFYESKQLLDKEFEAVYSNLIVDEFTTFSEIYYNSTYGVIGFKDRKDDLYVFKEFAD